jgi:outer membrane protein
MFSHVRAALAALGMLAVVTAGASAQSSSTAAPATSAPPKFAFVDSRVILERAPGRAAAESTFQKEYAKAQEQIKKMQDTLQAMMSSYQKTKATLTPVNQELREREISEKQQSFENRANLLDAQMQQRQAALVQPITAQIRAVLDTVRTEESYTFIFDVGAQANVVVAADKSLDITEKVIGRLKPIPVGAPSKSDSTKAQPAGGKPQPAGVTRKPPTE